MVATSHSSRALAANRNTHEHFTEVDYAKNVTQMFRLVEERRWNDVIDLCKREPKQASMWVVRRNKKEVNWRRLPIHEACIRDPSVDAINALIKAHPDGIQTPDHAERLPLHHASVHGAAVEVIEVIITAYPEGINKQDVWSKTPESAAAASTAPHRNAIVAALAKGPMFYVIKEHEREWRNSEQNQVKKLQAELEDQKRRHSKALSDIETQTRNERRIMKSNVQELERRLEASTKEKEFLKECLDQTTTSEKFLKEAVQEMKLQIADDSVASFAAKQKHGRTMEILKKEHEEKMGSMKELLKKEKEEREKDLALAKENHAREKGELVERIQHLMQGVEDLSNENVVLDTKLERTTEELRVMKSAMSDISEEQRDALEVVTGRGKEIDAAASLHAALLSSLSDFEKHVKSLQVDQERCLGTMTKQSKLAKAALERVSPETEERE